MWGNVLRLNFGHLRTRAGMPREPYRRRSLRFAGAIVERERRDWNLRPPGDRPALR
jgi:hypothetical protein